MTEENARRFFETLARIISEREKIKVTVKVRRKKEHEKVTADKAQ